MSRYSGARNKFKKGEEVYIPELGEYGTVMNDSHAPEMYRVDIGDFVTYWFNQSEIQSVEESLNPE